MFNSKEESLKFFEYLNQQHPNIKFTIEEEHENKISFLDILIENRNSLKTSVYQKSTYTGLLMNFYSFTPFSYKVGLIKTLVDRTFKITNTWEAFHKNIVKLTETLGKNMFPTSLVNSCIKQHLQKQYESKNNANRNNKEKVALKFSL